MTAADPSSPIDALRERMATELAMHYVVEDNAFPLCCSCGKDFAGYIAWRRHAADAVLDALGLEQVGWFIPGQFRILTTGGGGAEPVCRFSPGKATTDD